jgi:hypothetical protein
VVSSKKKSTVMSPIRRRMKKRNPSSGQNGQLVHWWLLIHSGRGIVNMDNFEPFRLGLTLVAQSCCVTNLILGP